MIALGVGVVVLAGVIFFATRGDDGDGDPEQAANGAGGTEVEAEPGDDELTTPDDTEADGGETTASSLDPDDEAAVLAVLGEAFDAIEDSRCGVFNNLASPEGMHVPVECFALGINFEADNSGFLRDGEVIAGSADEAFVRYSISFAGLGEDDLAEVEDIARLVRHEGSWVITDFGNADPSAADGGLPTPQNEVSVGGDVAGEVQPLGDPTPPPLNHDDSFSDELAQSCYEGSYFDCDFLVGALTADDEQRAYGATCGGRVETPIPDQCRDAYGWGDTGPTDSGI